MRNTRVWLLASGLLTAGGIASAMPPDPMQPSPAEPNVPPPAQPGPPTPSPDDPLPPQIPASPVPVVPITPATPVVDPDVPQPTAAAVTPEPSVEVVPYPYGAPRPYTWYRPQLASDIGVAVTVGGGISGFTDKAMRDSMASDVGGMWDVRAAFGTHIPLGIELGYVGTAGNMQSFAGTPNGTLVGTAVEGALRWTMLPHRAWTPYLFAGMGWQHYAVYDNTLQTADSGLKRSDDIAEFPLGAGFSFRDVGGFTFDLRGTYRAETASTLLKDPENHYAGLENWEASAALGYEF